MSQNITITLDRADAERMERFFREAALFRTLVMAQNDGVDECRRFSEMFKAALDAALAAPAEGPERAATGQTLEALIAECERHDWEWRLERVCIDDAPDSCVLTRIASVKPLAWQGKRFDDTDEDGWFGLSDTDADGSITDLLRETMRWANERTNIHARVNLAAIGGGKGGA